MEVIVESAKEDVCQHNHHEEIGKTACEDNKGIAKSNSVFVGDKQDKKAYMEANALLTMLQGKIVKDMTQQSPIEDGEKPKKLNLAGLLAGVKKV